MRVITKNEWFSQYEDAYLTFNDERFELWIDVDILPQARIKPHEINGPFKPWSLKNHIIFIKMFVFTHNVDKILKWFNIMIFSILYCQPTKASNQSFLPNYGSW